MTYFNYILMFAQEKKNKGLDLMQKRKHTYKQMHNQSRTCFPGKRWNNWRICEATQQKEKIHSNGWSKEGER